MSEVNGAETTDTTMVPPILYVPLHRSTTEGDPRVEIRELKDGRMALLAYTALDRLVQLCGPHQPWILVRTAELDQIKANQPFDVVIFDLEIPEQYRTDGALR